MLDEKVSSQGLISCIREKHPEATTFESLNLTNDAILLAVSCILQGACPRIFPSPNYKGEMAALMADISADIRTDGKLDNETLIRKLIINAYDISVLDNTNPYYISLSDIRKNINARYTKLGFNITIPDFESHVQAFKDFTFDSNDATTPTKVKKLYLES